MYKLKGKTGDIRELQTKQISKKEVTIIKLDNYKKWKRIRNMKYPKTVTVTNRKSEQIDYWRLNP